MIGIFLELLITWLLLKFAVKENFSTLGLSLTRERLKYVLIGFILPIIYFCALHFSVAYVTGNPYKFNHNYTWNAFLQSGLYVLRGVIYEELLFRGFLLYILIKYTGRIKASLISAIAFGIYHWFSWNLFGQPTAMLVTFLNTGLIGFLYALLFAKTQSMYLPAALHMGSNFATMIIFSKYDSIGIQLLTKTFIKDPIVPPPLVSMPMLIIYLTGFHIMCYIIFKLHKPQTISQQTA